MQRTVSKMLGPRDIAIKSQRRKSFDYVTGLRSRNISLDAFKVFKANVTRGQRTVTAKGTVE